MYMHRYMHMNMCMCMCMYLGTCRLYYEFRFHTHLIARSAALALSTQALERMRSVGPARGPMHGPSGPRVSPT